MLSRNVDELRFPVKGSAPFYSVSSILRRDVMFGFGEQSGQFLVWNLVISSFERAKSKRGPGGQQQRSKSHSGL